MDRIQRFVAVRRCAAALAGLSCLLSAVTGCGGGGGSAVAAAPAPAASPVSQAAPASQAAWGAARASARIFVSGHSLTDNPFGDDLVAIANSLGGADAGKYNQQIYLGSPIAARTGATIGWIGYSRGKNRDGDGMNVINELRSPQTIGGDRYDTLVIAENHNLLDMLRWEATVGNLRHYHERLLEGNAAGRSYFYETWTDIRDVDDPRAWITHERAQSKAWQCIAQRVNHSLAAEGRSDRITPLPTGAALADLLERGTAGSVAGISAGSARDTVARLFSDGVHLTETGVYYVALVTYAAVYQRSPVGAAVPAGVDAATARSLQEHAWGFVSGFYADYRAPELGACREQVVREFCPIYWNYRGRPDAVADCARFFSAAGPDNPLYYAADSDRSYWYPAPP